MELKSVDGLNRDQKETEKLEVMINRNKDLEQTISNLWEKLELKNDELTTSVNNTNSHVSALLTEKEMSLKNNLPLDLHSAQVLFQALISRLTIPSDSQVDLYNSFHIYYNSVSCLYDLFQTEDNTTLTSDVTDETNHVTNERNIDLSERLRHRLQKMANAVQCIAQYIYKLSQALGVDQMIKSNRSSNVVNGKDHDIEDIKTQLHQNYSEIIQWISMQNSLAIEEMQTSKDQRIQRLEEIVNNQDNQLIKLNQMKDKFHMELLEHDQQSSNYVDTLTKKLTDLKDENEHLNRKSQKLENLLKQTTDDFHEKNKSYIQQCQGIQFKIEDMIVTNRQELDILQKEYELNNPKDRSGREDDSTGIQLLDVDELKNQRKESLKELEMKWEGLLHSAKMEIVSLKEQHNRELQLLDEKYREDVDKLQKRLDNEPLQHIEIKNHGEEVAIAEYEGVVLRKKNRKRNNASNNTNIMPVLANPSTLPNGNQALSSSVTDKLHVNTNRFENLKIQFHQEITNLLAQIDRLIVSENADNQQLQAWAAAIQQLHTVYQAEVDLLFQEYRILQQSVSLEKQKTIDDLTQQHHDDIIKLKKSLAAEAEEKDLIKRKELEDHFNENLVQLTASIEKQCQQHYDEELTILREQMNKEVDDIKKKFYQEWSDSHRKDTNISVLLEDLSMEQQNYHQMLIENEYEISSKLEKFCDTELESLRNKLNSLDDKASMINQVHDTLLHYKQSMVQFMIEEIQKYYQNNQDVVKNYHRKIEDKIMNLYKQGLDNIHQLHEDDIKQIKNEVTSTLTSHHQAAMAELKDNYQKELLTKIESAKSTLRMKLDEQHEEELNNLRHHLQDKYENSIMVALDELKRKEKLSQDQFDERVEKTINEILEQKQQQHNDEKKIFQEQIVKLEEKLTELQNNNGTVNAENKIKNISTDITDNVDEFSKLKQGNSHGNVAQINELGNTGKFHQELVDKRHVSELLESQNKSENYFNQSKIDLLNGYEPIINSIELLLKVTRHYLSVVNVDSSKEDNSFDNRSPLLLTEMVFEVLKKMLCLDNIKDYEFPTFEVEKIHTLIKELEPKWATFTRNDWISMTHCSDSIHEQGELKIYEALPKTLTRLKSLIPFKNTIHTSELSINDQDIYSADNSLLILETICQLLLAISYELASDNSVTIKRHNDQIGGLTTISTTQGRQSFPPLYKDFMLQLISQLESMKRDLKQVLEYFAAINTGNSSAAVPTLTQYLQPILKKIIEFIGDPTVIEDVSRSLMPEENFKTASTTVSNMKSNNGGDVMDIDLKLDQNLISSKTLTRDHFNYLEAMIVQNYQFDQVLDLEIDKKSVAYGQYQQVIDKECLSYEKRCKIRLQKQLDANLIQSEIDLLMKQCDKARMEVKRCKNRLVAKPDSESSDDFVLSKEKFLSELASQKQFAAWLRHRIDKQIVCSMIIKELFIMQLDQLSKQQESVVHKLKKDEKFIAQRKSIINQLDTLGNDLLQEQKSLRDCLIEDDTSKYESYKIKQNQSSYTSYPSSSGHISTASSYILAENSSRKETETSLNASNSQNSGYIQNLTTSSPLEISFKRASFASPTKSDSYSSYKRSSPKEDSLALRSRLTDDSPISSSLSYRVSDSNSFLGSRNSRDKCTFHSVSNISSPNSSELSAFTNYHARSRLSSNRSNQRRLSQDTRYWEEIQTLRQDLALHQHLRSQQELLNLK